jgi:hypothetical protein
MAQPPLVTASVMQTSHFTDPFNLLRTAPSLFALSTCMTALNQAPDAGIGSPGNRQVAALYQNAYVSASS